MNFLLLALGMMGIAAGAQAAPYLADDYSRCTPKLPFSGLSSNYSITNEGHLKAEVPVTKIINQKKGGDVESLATKEENGVMHIYKLQRKNGRAISLENTTKSPSIGLEFTDTNIFKFDGNKCLVDQTIYSSPIAEPMVGFDRKLCDTIMPLWKRSDAKKLEECQDTFRPILNAISLRATELYYKEKKKLAGGFGDQATGKGLHEITNILNACVATFDMYDGGNRYGMKFYPGGALMAPPSGGPVPRKPFDGSVPPPERTTNPFGSASGG